MFVLHIRLRLVQKRSVNPTEEDKPFPRLCQRALAATPRRIVHWVREHVHLAWKRIQVKLPVAILGVGPHLR